MTDTVQDMLMASASLEIERLKARLREVEAERDDLGFRLRLFEKAYEDLVAAIRKLPEEPVVEPTPEELAVAEAENAKYEAGYVEEHGHWKPSEPNLSASRDGLPSSFDYWYDHANGRYQRY